MKNKIILTTVTIIVLVALGVLFIKPNKQSDETELFNNLVYSASSINLEKSFYKPNEEVLIQITANCSDELELQVNNQELKTEKSINCGQDPNLANHYSIFKTETEGEYKLRLTNKSTSETGEAAFIVSKEDKDFEIYRWGSKAINLDQNSRAVMKLTLFANKDFSGQLVETIPEDIAVVWHGPATVEDNKLVWDVALSAGEKAEFNYEYTTQGTDPFALGPSALTKNNREIYTNLSVWPITTSNND